MAKQDLNRRTVTSTVNTQPMPTLVRAEYDNTPFEYKPGTSVADIISLGKSQSQVFDDQEQRQIKLAKVKAATDFFKSLGLLAGGGYANTPQYQDNGLVPQLFQNIDKLRSDKMQSDRYYGELANRTRQQDYQNQLTSYNKLREQDYQQTKFNADQANRANMKQYEQGGQRIQEIYEDQTLANKRLGVQQYQAETARIRAEKSGEKEDKNKGNNDVIFTINQPDGTQKELNQGNALKLVDRVVADITEKKKSATYVLSPEEEQILAQAKNAKINRGQLTKTVDLIRKTYNAGEYEPYWTKSGKKMLLPGQSAPILAPQQTQRKSLLPK